MIQQEAEYLSSEKINYFYKKKDNEMKNFTVTIPDNKENIFIEMMNSISFVQKIQASDDIAISEEQKEIVRNRIQRMEEDPESCLSWEDIERKIKL